MKFEIHSFESIQRKAQQPFAPHTALISIGDPDAPPPKLLHKPAHFLRLVFDDITAAEAMDRLELPFDKHAAEDEIAELLLDYHTVLYTEKMADKTAAFILKHFDETEVFICQCEHGQSRSAACVAAMAEHYFHRGVDIFADERYFPNKLVYKRLLKALEKAACER